MVAIHALVEQKFAFLSFYYLPLILAGFYGGRRFAVMAGGFVVSLIFFYQYVQGLDMLPGFYPDALLALGPWAGFLDRKSTRLNSSHGYISYAVFCFEKKKNIPL